MEEKEYEIMAVEHVSTFIAEMIHVLVFRPVWEGEMVGLNFDSELALIAFPQSKIDPEITRSKFWSINPLGQAVKIMSDGSLHWGWGGRLRKKDFNLAVLKQGKFTYRTIREFKDKK